MATGEGIPLIGRFQHRFGAAGLVVAIVALVAALAGTAFAAAKLTAKQKKEVQRIAKRFAGKNGKQGPAGPAGPTGPAGPQGPQGAAGANGSDGKDGAPGKSVVLVNEEPAGCPNQSGVTYEIEGSGEPNEVCNGQTGFTQFLPSGETLTGAWAGTTADSDEGFLGLVGISFSIPLESQLDSAHVKLVTNPAAVPSECNNSEKLGEPSVANPEAQPGYLCVFQQATGSGGNVVEGIYKPDGVVSVPLSKGASKTGAILNLISAEPTFAYGSWAVTAP